MKEQFSTYALVVVFFAALGGFLFGYNTGVISGGLLFVEKEFSLSVLQEGIAVGIILLGGLFGSLFAGELSDRMGRRMTLILNSFLYVIGIALVFFSQSFSIFLMGRFITGMAIGVTSIAAPLYLAEMAPAHNRGAFVSVHQLAITVGILVAYAVNYLLAAAESWRWMFGIGVIPAIVQFFGMLCLPETPSWLMAHGHPEKGMEVLRRIRKKLIPGKYTSEMKHVAGSKKLSHFSQLFAPKLRKALIIGVLLSLFQIITGINTVIYYAPKILQMPVNASLLATIGIGIANMIATGAAVFLLDSQGRKKMLLWGLSGMTLCLIVLTLNSYIHLGSIVGLIFVIAYVACFAASLGPITWVVISEIYPLHIRGRAMSIAIFVNWLANYLVSLFFPDLVQQLSLGGTFLLFAVISLLALWFVYVLVPETKNKSLEQIEESL